MACVNLLATLHRVFLSFSGAGVCALLEDHDLISRAFPGTATYRARRGPGIARLIKAGASADEARPYSAAKLYGAACFYARQENERAAAKMAILDRLSVVCFPTGIAFADRTRERGGDYLRLAFLPFRSLALEWSNATMPAVMREEIIAQAAAIQARRGERYEVSACGQTVLLGEEIKP
jgi:hypothetical protein